jgi:hypothetical protein
VAYSSSYRFSDYTSGYSISDYSSAYRFTDFVATYELASISVALLTEDGRLLLTEGGEILYQN